jgi:hypothetical protein
MANAWECVVCLARCAGEPIARESEGAAVVRPLDFMLIALAQRPDTIPYIEEGAELWPTNSLLTEMGVASLRSLMKFSHAVERLC